MPLRSAHSAVRNLDVVPAKLASRLIFVKSSRSRRPETETVSLSRETFTPSFTSAVVIASVSSPGAQFEITDSESANAAQTNARFAIDFEPGTVTTRPLFTWVTRQFEYLDETYAPSDPRETSRHSPCQ